jgi:hypothetical protein
MLDKYLLSVRELSHKGNTARLRQENAEMLTATGTIRNQWNRDEVGEFSHDFARVDALEDFLAYNRAYIITLSFTGKFTREEDN